MKKRIALLAFVLIFCLSGCEEISQLQAAQEKEINTMEALNQEVEQALESGQKEITFVTEELQESDLETLNEAHDGFYGCVIRYQIKDLEWIGKRYMTLYCEIGDNFYVEDALLNGGDIPEGYEKAEELKQTCEAILEDLNLSDAGTYKKEKKIHNYLVSHTTYGYPDAKREDSDAYNAYGALVSKKAVCNGYAQAMKLLCDLSGVECKMITGKAGKESHAWNLIRLGEEWYHVDVTWDDPEPDDPSRILYPYFNVDDEQMKESHTWEMDQYPQAEGTKYNYYVRNDLYCENWDEFKQKCIDIFEEESPENFQVMVRDFDETMYSEKNLQFMFEYSEASHFSYLVIGEKPYTMIYFELDNH